MVSTLMLQILNKILMTQLTGGRHSIWQIVWGVEGARLRTSMASGGSRYGRERAFNETIIRYCTISTKPSPTSDQVLASEFRTVALFEKGRGFRSN